MSQEAHLIPCSPQKPLSSETQPKLVGTGPPAKPVLLRSTPKPLTPAPLAKASRPPTKPVAVSILAQDQASPETSECYTPPFVRGRLPRMGLGVWCHPVPYPHPLPQLQSAQSWFGTQHLTRSTSRSQHSRSRISSGSISSRHGEAGPRPSGQLRSNPSFPVLQTSGLLTISEFPVTFRE